MKCRKNRESRNPQVAKKAKEKIILLSKCATCNSKKSRFIKKQVASGLLSSLRLKGSIIKIILLGDILF